MSGARDGTVPATACASAEEVRALARRVGARGRALWPGPERPVARRVPLGPAAVAEPVPVKRTVPLAIDPEPEAGAALAGRGAAAIPVRFIVAHVAAATGFALETLYGPVRSPPVSRVRQAAMLLAREITGRSFPDLARRMGRADHSTILHGVAQAQRRAAAEPDFAAWLEAMRATIRAGWAAGPGADPGPLRKAPPPAFAVAYVASAMGVARRDILGAACTREARWARACTAALMRDVLGLGLEAISAALCGNAHHWTASTLIETVRTHCAADAGAASRLSALRAGLLSAWAAQERAEAM